MPNESRDSGDYYCLPCRPRGRGVLLGIPARTLPFVSVHHGSVDQTPESTRKSKGNDVSGLCTSFSSQFRGVFLTSGPSDA